MKTLHAAGLAVALLATATSARADWRRPATEWRNTGGEWHEQHHHQEGGWRYGVSPPPSYYRPPPQVYYPPAPYNYVPRTNCRGFPFC